MIPRFLTFSLIVWYLSGTSSALGLGWTDAEWLEQNCPQGVEGIWQAETQSAYSGQEVEFRRDGTLLIVRSGRDLVLRIEGEMNPADGSFVELTVREEGSGYPPVIKIRPHLVSSHGASCQIKMFRYQSAAHARQNRESSWDIYRRMN